MMSDEKGGNERAVMAAAMAGGEAVVTKLPSLLCFHSWSMLREYSVYSSFFFQLRESSIHLRSIGLFRAQLSLTIFVQT